MSNNFFPQSSLGSKKKSKPKDGARAAPLPGSGARRIAFPSSAATHENPDFRSMTMGSNLQGIQISGLSSVSAYSNIKPATSNFDGPDLKKKMVPMEAPVVPKPNASRKTGWNVDSVQLDVPDMYFPRDLIKCEMPRSELKEVLTRIQTFLRTHSVQAEYEDQPASAKLRTMDRVELWLKFWEGTSGTTFYVDIQRSRGDKSSFFKVVNQITEVAKGVADPNLAHIPMDMCMDQIERVEAMLGSMSSAEGVPAASGIGAGGGIIQMIELVHLKLTSNLPGDRKMGLESIIALTDLNRTMSAAACPMALVALKGEAPPVDGIEDQKTLSRKCEEIHQVLMRVVLERKFDGDEELMKVLASAHIEVEPFMPSEDDTGTSSVPQQYRVYIAEMFSMVLMVLVNSLEVVCCFDSKMGVIDSVVGSMLMARGGLYETLLECLEDVQYRMGDAYLACKMMRLCASSSSMFRGRLRGDVRYAECVNEALHTGSNSHTMLQVECEKLSVELKAA